MNVREIEMHDGTLNTLKELLSNKARKVHGVFYTNSFFSQRYLSRSHLLVDDLNIEEDTVKLTVSTRLEKAGLMEIENTLAILEQHTAGDIPGFTPEGLLPDGDTTGRPFVAEPIGVKQQLFSVDLFLILKEPKITYQKFVIAGCEFRLVNITHQLDDYFEQTVTVLFGDAAKLSFFSHFFDKELTEEDIRLIFEMIVDENITGKAVQSVKVETEGGVASSIYPFEELISSYETVNGDIVFGTGSGYLRIKRGALKNYRLECIPYQKTGTYSLWLTSHQDSIKIFME